MIISTEARSDCGEKMHTELAKTLELLDRMGDDLYAASKNDGMLPDIGGGWNSSPISASGLGWWCYELLGQLKKDPPEDLPQEDVDRFIMANRTLEAIDQHNLPNYKTNPVAGLPAILDGLAYVQGMLSPYLGAVAVEKGNMPAALNRKLIAARRDLDSFIPDKEEFRGQVAEIREAYEAADALPTTLAELNKTLAEVRQISSSASEAIGRVKQAEQSSRAVMQNLERQAGLADELVKTASEAYRITTTIGLAAAFDERAKSLNHSVYWWVGGLLISLLSVIGIGAFRLEAMHDALTAAPFDRSRVWIQFLISLLGVGAPIWFGWVSTKQIGQRFRLAEDYAFKASVSKAYEGYRREAASLSPEFASSLFASALKRLDEPPLRLLEMTTHGSPLHELVNSPMVDKVLERLPTLKNRPPQETGGD